MHKPPEQKLSERQQRSKPIFDAIRNYLYELQVLPQSSIGKARDYMLKYFKELTVFLSDGRLAINNNIAERGLRGPVIGRKNFYGITPSAAQKRQPYFIRSLRAAS